jgi:hypothetical protein
MKFSGPRTLGTCIADAWCAWPYARSGEQKALADVMNPRAPDLFRRQFTIPVHRS